MRSRLALVATLICVAIPSLAVPAVAAAAAQAPKVVAIATGDNHTCALTGGGAVKCWGFNASGQLGDGTTTNRSTPVDVAGLQAGVRAIAAGGDHTCALMTAGTVRCWGYNFSRELGDGTTTNRSTPVDVSTVAGGVSAIAAGMSHTCVQRDDGDVTCWGASYVSGKDIVAGARAIAAGGDHACALTGTGGVACWGNNAFGGLGTGTTASFFTDTAAEVTGMSRDIAAVAVGGQNTCALTIDGQVACWGPNGRGQLGDGTTTDSSVPVGVSGLASEAIALAAANHMCAVTKGGAVRCWGWNEVGQVGDGTTTDRAVPVSVARLASGVKAVSVGFSHTCVLTDPGGVLCWGRNAEGQLGDGSILDRHTPVHVSGLDRRAAPPTDVADAMTAETPAPDRRPVLLLLASFGAGLVMFGRRRVRPDGT